MDSLAVLIAQSTGVLFPPEELAYRLNRAAAWCGRDVPPSISDLQDWDGSVVPPYELAESLAEEAVSKGLIDNAGWAKERWISGLMGCLTPDPSSTQRVFWDQWKVSPQEATAGLFRAQSASGYIRTDRMALNRAWLCPTEWGTLTITVNLSKPEKDPASIAAAARTGASGYPLCPICRENEGYAGTAAAAPRHCLRLIPLTLGGEEWYFQFSPYGYYEQHAIVLSREHRPMATTGATFSRLLEFVDLFPHYFIGSNADIPLVGGSILSHDHYQCGTARFAMDDAPARRIWQTDRGVSVQWLRWPLTVLRLESRDRGALIAEAESVNNAWLDWNDPTGDVISKTGEERHNAVTTVARKLPGGVYRLDLALRNNRVTARSPHGLFCPHEEVHAVKRENIGLIEVMGLAILPPRTLDLIARSLEALRGDESAKQGLKTDFPSWYHRIGTLEPRRQAIEQAVGQLFALGLEQCAVLRESAAVERFARFLGWRKDC